MWKAISKIQYSLLIFQSVTTTSPLHFAKIPCLRVCHSATNVCPVGATYKRWQSSEQSPEGTGGHEAEHVWVRNVSEAGVVAEVFPDLDERTRDRAVTQLTHERLEEGRLGQPNHTVRDHYDTW